MADNVAAARDEEASIGAVNLTDKGPPPYQPNYGTEDPAPPDYSSVNPTDAPPSYDSIFGQVKAAKQSSSGTVEFFKNVFVIIVSTIGCTICVALFLAFPISMIVMGAEYFGSCPREHYIPIYLIVAGTFGVVRNLSSMTQRCKNQHEGNEQENAKSHPVDSILSCFLVAWFIAGNVWIYSIYNDFQSDNPTASDFCDATLYYFAFWVTTLVYIIMGLSCFCVCCAGVMASVVNCGETTN